MNYDYDSIIREGQTALKYGNSPLSNKDNPDSGKQYSVIKREDEGPSVIKELSEPIIINKIKSTPEIPVEEKSPVIKKPDYDSIIREGQSSLKNGNNNSKKKDQSKTAQNTDRETQPKKNEHNGPAVIGELSEPVITKENLFTIIPGGR